MRSVGFLLLFLWPSVLAAEVVTIDCPDDVGSAVSVNQIQVARCPASLDLAPGEYQIAVKTSDGRTWGQKLQVVSGGTFRLTAIFTAPLDVPDSGVEVPTGEPTTPTPLITEPEPIAEPPPPPPPPPFRPRELRPHPESGALELPSEDYEPIWYQPTGLDARADAGASSSGKDPWAAPPFRIGASYSVVSFPGERLQGLGSEFAFTVDFGVLLGIQLGVYQPGNFFFAGIGLPYMGHAIKLIDMGLPDVSLGLLMPDIETRFLSDFESGGFIVNASAYPLGFRVVAAQSLAIDIRPEVPGFWLFVKDGLSVLWSYGLNLNVGFML